MSFTSTLTLIGAAGSSEEEIYFSYEVDDQGGDLTLEAVYVDTQYNIYAAGQLETGLSTNDGLYVVKLDRNGVKQWDNLFQVGQGPSSFTMKNTRAGALRVDSSGGVFVSVNVDGTDEYGTNVIKISSDGSQILAVAADTGALSTSVSNSSMPGNIFLNSEEKIYSVSNTATASSIICFNNSLTGFGFLGNSGARLEADNSIANKGTLGGVYDDKVLWFSQAQSNSFSQLNSYDIEGDVFTYSDYISAFTIPTFYPTGGTSLGSQEVGVILDGGTLVGAPDFYGLSYSFDNSGAYDACVVVQYDALTPNTIAAIYTDTYAGGSYFYSLDAQGYGNNSYVAVGTFEVGFSNSNGVAFRHFPQQMISNSSLGFRLNASRTSVTAVNRAGNSFTVLGINNANPTQRNGGGFCIAKLPISLDPSLVEGLYSSLQILDYTGKILMQSGTVDSTATGSSSEFSGSNIDTSFGTETVTGVTYTAERTLIEDGYPVGYFDFAAIANTGDSFTSGLSTAGGCWGDSGTKFYINDYGGETVYQYTASTAYDISSLTSASKNKTVTDGALARGMQFKPDGTRLFITFQNSGGMRAYDLSTAWDISTMSATSSSSIPSLTGDGNNAGMFISADGIKVFVTNFDAEVRRWDLNVAWDLDNRSNSFIADLSASVNSGRGLVFSPDGTEMIYLSSSASLLTYFALVTPWNPQTAVELDSLLIPEVSTPVTVVDDGSGTNLYVADNLNGVIRQYSL